MKGGKDTQERGDKGGISADKGGKSKTNNGERYYNTRHDKQFYNPYNSFEQVYGEATRELWKVKKVVN